MYLSDFWDKSNIDSGRDSASPNVPLKILQLFLNIFKMFLMFLHVIKITEAQTERESNATEMIKTPPNLNPLMAEIQIATLSRYSCFANVWLIDLYLK